MRVGHGDVAGALEPLQDPHIGTPRLLVKDLGDRPVQLDASLPVAIIRSGRVLGVEPSEAVVEDGVGVVAQASHADLLAYDVPMSGAYTVSARRWSGGWELRIAGEGVTQVRTLNQADAQVRDWLQTMHERDFSDAVIEVAIHD